MQTEVVRGEFRRPMTGPTWAPFQVGPDFSWRGGLGWQSNGGPSKRHPARALPYSLEFAVPEHPGRLTLVKLVGIFAMHADAVSEPIGAIGGILQFLDGGSVVHRQELVQGRQYSDPTDLTQLTRVNGDGTRIESIGSSEIEGNLMRLDVLAVDVPVGVRVQSVVFRDLGTPASFVIFDVGFEFEVRPVCPFRGHGHHVSLREVGGILRLRDRARFDRAIAQVVDGIEACGDDLDEARGLALTFLAVTCASLLEMGAPKSLHRFQLDMARKLDKIDSLADIARLAVDQIHDLTAELIPRSSVTGDALVDKALTLINRNFSRPLTDEVVADELGISTSHFRFLFRKATEKPFHKFLLATRLEKAREILLLSDQPIHEVSDHVGFASPAHFSRVFSQRFGVSPSQLRASRR